MVSHLCHLTAWPKDNYLTSLSLRFLINGNKNSKYLTGEENKLLSLMLSTECYRCYTEISTDVVLSLVILLFLYKCKSLKTSPKKAFVGISQYLCFSYLSLSPLFLSVFALHSFFFSPLLLCLIQLVQISWKSFTSVCENGQDHGQQHSALDLAFHSMANSWISLRSPWSGSRNAILPPRSELGN